MTSGSGETAIELRDVRFKWPGKRGFGIAADGFSVKRGERVLLLGPSGAGKSTLLNLICGVVAPDLGGICICGQDIAALKASVRDRYRAEHFGIIFQMFNLLPYATARDNVLLPLGFAPRRRKRASSGGSTLAEATRLLDEIGLSGRLATHEPAANLSVGQQQRVAAARALIGSPEIIVADEPTSALDGDTQAEFMQLLFSQSESSGATVVMVSHDERLARYFDRSARLADIARISPEGEP